MHEQSWLPIEKVAEDFNRSFLQEGDVLASGAYGKVYNATERATGEAVIVKTMAGDKLHEAAREVSILEVLEHTNVIRLLDVYASSTRINLVLERWGTDLKKSMARSALNACKIQSYTAQMFEAVAYIHTMGLCHNDLKPQNMLVHGDSLKICDFGLARSIIAEIKVPG